MKLTRRELVVAGLTVSLGNAFKMDRLQAASEGTLPSPLTVAITGIISETHPSRLAALQNPFLALRVPVTVCVRPTNGTGFAPAPRSKLAHSLQATLDANPDLFEVAIDAKEFGSDDPYLQLRQASDAQSALTRSLNPVGDFHRQSLFAAQTLLTTTTSMGREHLACLRAAGIRTVIHVPAAIEAEQPVVAAGYWMTSTHLAKTFALAATSAQAGAEGPRRSINEMRAGLQAEAAQRNPITVHISFAAFDDLNQDGLSEYAHALAQLLSGMRDDGSVRLLLPYTLYRQTTRGPAQYIIVRVDALCARGSDRAHRNFTMKLLQAGIPVSESVMPSRYDSLHSEPLATDSEAKRYLENALLNPGYDIAIRGPEHTSKELALGALEHNSAITQSMREIYAMVGISPTAYVTPDETFDEDTLVRIAECGIRMLSTEPGSNQLTWGLGQTGLLNISNSVRFERPQSTDLSYYDSAEMLRVIGTRNDAVLIIRPPTVSSSENMQKISDVLSALSTQNGTRLVNFSQYYKAVVPKMPLVETIREARMQRLIIDPSFPIAEAVSVDDLKADARIAWHYFDRMSVENTGLVLGTAWEISGKIEGYAFATMWDLGSLLMAYCSAYKLELIDQTRFEVGTRGVIEFLGQSFFRYRDSLLPNTERAIAKGPTPRDGFDAIDTGRLLIGLKRLDNLTARSLPIESLVKKWDFNAVLADGEMHNVTPSGRLMSVHESSYALYAARGYNLWGLELKPVFAVEQPTANMDNTLIFLTEVARRGAVATEPWTTEHIELSSSEYTTIIEDVLYAAQIRRRADTGYLTSVSEMAIDHDPWFIYQGYQIDLDGGTWRVDTSTANERFANEKFVASNRAISSKGAFLWLATRPGEYTADLYRLVREKCRTDNLGFSSGIYERSGVPSRLSDVNSNGLILEAIEYMLSAQSPLLHRL